MPDRAAGALALLLGSATAWGRGACRGGTEAQRGEGNRVPHHRLHLQGNMPEGLGAGVSSSPSWSHLHGPGRVAAWSLSPRWQQAGTLLEDSACGPAGHRLLGGASPRRWTGWQASLRSPVSGRGREAGQPRGARVGTEERKLMDRDPPSLVLGHTSAGSGTHARPADPPGSLQTHALGSWGPEAW